MEDFAQKNEPVNSAHLFIDLALGPFDWGDVTSADRFFQSLLALKYSLDLFYQAVVLVLWKPLDFLG
jgi:hypothetical protein